MKRNRLALLGVLALLALPVGALAQSFPTKPVHIVNPYAPGGSGDVAARILADNLSEQWGQPVIVEHRPGAGSIVGTQYVQRSAADGYTLLLASPSFLMGPMLKSEAKYDALRDFVPVARVATSPLVVAVNAASTARTLTGLLDDARRAPGRITYAAVGPGTVPHLVGEMLRLDAKVDWIYVPYQGGLPVVSALLGGHVTAVVANYAEVRQHIAVGRLRALAVGSAERLDTLPRVPTLAERGHEAIDGTIWFGFVAPAGTPREVVQRIASSLRRALENPSVHERLVEQGLIPVENSPEQFAAFLRAQSAQFGQAIKRAGLRPD